VPKGFSITTRLRAGSRSSAEQLNRVVQSCGQEQQIFRIDHYLGKETVQNILVLRFANTIFEPIWNRNYIANVQITAAETVGVEERAGYYETSGALRDMVQNHLTQMLALTAMETPGHFDPESIRSEKAKVLQAARLANEDEPWKCCVRGQYSRGGNPANPMAGYREEPGVNPESTTETYVAMKLFIDNWRWQGVPFYLRTGKPCPNGSRRWCSPSARHPCSCSMQPAAPPPPTSWCCASSPMRAPASYLT